MYYTNKTYLRDLKGDDAIAKHLNEAYSSCELMIEKKCFYPAYDFYLKYSYLYSLIGHKVCECCESTNHPNVLLDKIIQKYKA